MAQNLLQFIILLNSGKLKPGEFILKDEEIVLNANKDSISIKVTNKGDRPIQVGSHFHFFETNKLLVFDREMAYGKRLDIASGTSVTLQSCESKSVDFISLGLDDYMDLYD